MNEYANVEVGSLALTDLAAGPAQRHAAVLAFPRVVLPPRDADGHQPVDCRQVQPMNDCSENFHGSLQSNVADIATDATPDEVRALFSNCRLIGRRFRLAHVYFRDGIVEVSTFRRDPWARSRLTPSPSEPGSPPGTLCCPAGRLLSLATSSFRPRHRPSPACCAT